MIGYQLNEKGCCYQYYCEIRAGIMFENDPNKKAKLVDEFCTNCKYFKPDSEVK